MTSKLKLVTQTNNETNIKKISSVLTSTAILPVFLTQLLTPAPPADTWARMGKMHISTPFIPSLGCDNSYHLIQEKPPVLSLSSSSPPWKERSINWDPSLVTLGLVPSLSFHFHVFYHDVITSRFSLLYLSKLSPPSLFCCDHSDITKCVKNLEKPEILVYFRNN